MEAATAAAEVVIAEVGADIPGATPVADIPAEDRADADGVALVPVHLPGRAKAISVTLDEGLIDRIDAVASNRSAFLAEAARSRLGR